MSVRTIDARRQRMKHDYVLIERFSDTVTEGGILLPERSSMNARMGRVLAVGPGLWDVAGQRFAPMHTKKGEVVLFTAAPDMVELGDGYVLVRDYCVVSADGPVLLEDEAGVEDLEEADAELEPTEPVAPCDGRRS